MIFLTNPPRRRKRKAKKRRRKLTAKQIAAGFGGKRRKVATTRRKRKGTTVARRKRSTGKRRKVAATTRRRRRGSARRRTGTITLRRIRGKVYRSNPAFGRGLVKQITEGARDGALVVVGETGAKFIGNLIPIPKDTMIGAVGAQLAGAIAIGMVGQRFLPKPVAHMLFVGGMAGAMRSVLKVVPVIGPMLGEYELPIGEYELPVGEYPQEDELAAYPEYELA
jgi:hypothetical protein